MLHGKLYYLGKGRGISDRASYNKAVLEWKRVLRAASEAASQPKEKPDSAAVATPPMAAAGEPRSENLRQSVERFIQSKAREARAGEISPRRTAVLRSGLSHIVEMFGEVPTRSLGAPQVKAVKDYLLDLKAKGQLKSSTAKLYFGDYRGFMRWAWQEESLPNLPRNLSERLFKDTQRDAKPKQYFQPKEVQRLYQYCLELHRKSVADGKADEERDLMTAALLLGLNCGFTQSDIADLKVGEVNLFGKKHRIVRKRSKTQVPSNHLLWRKTAEALRGWIEGKAPEHLVFQKEDRSPVAGRGENEGRHDIVGQKFARVIKAVFGQSDSRRFRELRRTSANRCAQRKGESVAQWFLAHTDKNVSSHYIERPQKQLDVMLAYLEVDYGFEQELNRVVVRRKPSR
jgi:hypothetical protein